MDGLDIQTYTPRQVRDFPDKPGVYRFLNKHHHIIYVGKAKNLKNRVSSYFSNTSGKDRKTFRMVSEIVSIQITIVNSEFDALLLENNLIKQNQPKYNILLRDDKSFPYVIIVKEPFPRIFPTRRKIEGQGRYYGPYTSVVALKTVLELFRNLYHLRTCSLNLSPENVQAGKYKVCLEYHIGKCKGPCVGLQEESDYLQDIEQAENILKGNLSPVKHYFKNKMNRHAEALEFEKAQEVKEKLELVEKFQTKSVIVNPNISEVDVFGFVKDTSSVYVNYLQVLNGAIIISQTLEVKKKLEEDAEEIFSQIIFDIRDKFKSETKEILSNIEVDYDLGVECRVPKIGDKKKLVDLAIKNALYFKKEKLQKSDPDYYREKRILQKLQEDLQLKTLPDHIECFDNSNLQGSNPVASMVCFKRGRPAKSDYRKYNVKTVEGPDDFASMKEIVSRRYSRVLYERSPLPSLIVIDGGKGQLNAAVEALREVGIYGKVPVIGLAKRLEEIFFPEDQFPVHIHKKSESLKLLQHIRNEAHRFAITFHRQKRSKAAISTQLTSIDGIGKNTANLLLQKFKSVKKIREASLQELEEVVGRVKAEKLRTFFDNEA